ncbi:MAG: GLUG motif-containing protein, partial [Candidatus Pacearchaeota archaeon]
DVGGIAGYSTGSINNSYNTGNVSGSSDVGGIAGYSFYGSISNSYNTGNVSGSSYYVGGIAGYSFYGSISNSFWDTETSGRTNACRGGSCTGAEGKTTSEMKNISTFSNANWNISLSNVSLNNGYPFLAWQVNNSSFVWLINPLNISIFDSIPPSVSLISPQNEINISFNKVNFIATFIDNINLKNATLYLWNHSGRVVGLNVTSISGFSVQLNLSLNLPYYGNFYWNYYVCDNSSNCAWGGQNRSFNYLISNDSSGGGGGGSLGGGGGSDRSQIINQSYQEDNTPTINNQSQSDLIEEFVLNDSYSSTKKQKNNNFFIILVIIILLILILVVALIILNLKNKEGSSKYFNDKNNFLSQQQNKNISNQDFNNINEQQTSSNQNSQTQINSNKSFRWT